MKIPIPADLDPNPPLKNSRPDPPPPRRIRRSAQACDPVSFCYINI